MPKRNKHAHVSDVNQLAHHLVQTSTSEQKDAIQPPTQEQISQVMAELGRRGGKVGGKRRLETMTARKRSEVAKRAAKARWHKNKK
jgi:hypothetical protein